MLSAALVTLSLSLLAQVNGLTLSARQDCSCGYKVAAHNNEYFQHGFDLDFSTLGLSGTATDAGWLPGMHIANGYRAGALSGSDGVTDPIGSLNNVRIVDGVLELVVPGGQKAGGPISSAQVEGPVAVGGVFTMDARIDGTYGTCSSMFTFHGANGNDEQDIEVLSAYLTEGSPDGKTPKGIELTNYNPNPPAGATPDQRRDYRIIDYPADPTGDYHKYTIAWTSTGTQYLFDGKAFAGPTQFSSVNPSSIILNHWTNGDPGFTRGPPANDAVLRVRRWTGYYKAPGDQGMPAGCSDAQVCQV